VPPKMGCDSSRRHKRRGARFIGSREPAPSASETRHIVPVLCLLVDDANVALGRGRDVEDLGVLELGEHVLGDEQIGPADRGGELIARREELERAHQALVWPAPLRAVECHAGGTDAESYHSGILECARARSQLPNARTPARRRRAGLFILGTGKRAL
jgi:hypothetical protein